MAQRKLDLEPGEGYVDKASPRRVAYRKLDDKVTGKAFISALEDGASISDACDLIGITVRQYRYKKDMDTVFRLRVKKALGMGSIHRILPLDASTGFLAACKWLCGVDVAREAFGLTRNQLSEIFKHNPEFRNAAFGAQRLGWIPREGVDGEMEFPAHWGRDRLSALAKEAMAREELT